MGRTVLGRFQTDFTKIQNFQVLLKSQSLSSTGRHFGSRIAFDDQNFVYFSVGDRGHRPNGQDLSTHAGSILRLHDDGRLPKDNPFVKRKGARPEIWSYGHRNPQGLTYDFQKKRLYAIEHGPRGGDEINWIQKGKNYGWPVVSFGREYHIDKPVGTAIPKKNMEQPLYQYTPSIAPCGLDIYYGKAFPQWRGQLLSGALKLTHLNRVDLRNSSKIKEYRHLQNKRWRIRNVRVGPDGLIYFSTDRGQLARLVPKK